MNLEYTFNLRRKGFFYAMFSAFLFGMMPLFSLLLYSFQVNSISLAFYRVFLTTPLLLYLGKTYSGMRICARELGQLLILSIFFALTPLLLFWSYLYIQSSTATALHFTYPACIVFFNRIIFKNKISLIELISLFISTIGVFIISDFQANGISLGFGLALLSGFTYALYSIYLEKSGLSNMNLFKILFYVGIFSSLFYLLSSFWIGPIRLDFKWNVWLLLIGFSIVLSVFATGFYQLGIKYIGAKNTSILSTLEPVTGVLMGVFVLKDPLDLKTTFAIGLILLSTFFIANNTKQVEEEVQNEQKKK